MQDKEFRTTLVTGGGYKGIPNGLKQLGLVSCACLHCTLYTVLLMSNQDKCVIQ